MARTEKLEIYGISDQGIAAAEALGLSNVFLAYCDFASGEAIQEIGFNSFSGYVFISKSKSRWFKDYLSNQINKMLIGCYYHQNLNNFSFFVNKILKLL